MTDPTSESDQSPAASDGGAEAKNSATHTPASSADGSRGKADVPAKPPADGMKEEIDKLTKQIADGEAAKPELQLLKPLYDKKAKSKTDYQAKRAGLVDRWQRQRCEILQAVKQVAAEQPKWVEVVNAEICTQLKAIEDAKQVVAGLQQELVLLQASSDVVVTAVKKAIAAKADADKLQQAWLDISSSLDKRLTEFDKRLATLKASAAPLSNPVNLYALFYDLLPDLLAAAPTDAPDDVKELTDLRDKLPCPPAAKPPPQLVTVDALSAAQDAARAAYLAAGHALDTAKQAVVDKTNALEAALTALAANIAKLTTQPAPPKPQPVAT